MDPMTLFELQAWLGHRSPHSTQHFAKLTPLTLAKAYTDACYSLATSAPLRSSSTAMPAQSGATASGSPWQHLDVGHGYCTQSFVE
jgi:hypothetical protein